MKANQIGVTLRGDRNQCAGCSRLFNSSHAFDKHRSGPHANNGRTCMTPEAMLAHGMVLGSDSFWRGSAMPESLLAGKPEGEAA